MGLFNGIKKPSIDLTDYKFVSDNHIRIQNEQRSNADNKGAWRGIRIQSPDNIIFVVAIYNLTGNHPVWGDNIQMSPKPMKLIEENNEMIYLRGIETFEASFSNYGITLHKRNGSITEITLLLFSKNTEIIYQEGNPADMDKTKEVHIRTKQNLDDTIIALKDYKQKWDTETPMQQKMEIAMYTDILNNKGCECYNTGHIDGAINCFKLALEVMPINDDALLNLTRSYNKKEAYLEAVEPLRKLYHLYPNTLNRNKSIAYSLLLHLINDFDSDGGAIDSSTLIDFIKSKFLFTTTDKEIKTVIQKINKRYNRDIIVYFIGYNSPMIVRGGSPYMTSSGTDLSLVKAEIRDVLDWE